MARMNAANVNAAGMNAAGAVSQGFFTAEPPIYLDQSWIKVGSRLCFTRDERGDEIELRHPHDLTVLLIVDRPKNTFLSG